MTAIIFSQLTSLFLIMLAGYFFTRIGVIDTRVVKGLSGLLTKLMLPALVLGSMQVPFSSDNAQLLGKSAIGMAIIILGGAAITFACTHFIKGLSKSERGTWMCLCAFPNALYIGKPLIEALYGGSVLFLLSAMTIVFNVLCFSVGVYLVNVGRDNHANTIASFFKSLLNPTLAAGLLGVILYFTRIILPAPILNSMSMLSSMLTPISMIIIGYSLVGVKLKELLFDWRVYALSVFRLIICPIVLYLIIKPLMADSMLSNVMLVLMLLPLATMVGVISEQYDSPHKELCSKSIVVSTILSLVSVPLMFALLSLI